MQPPSLEETPQYTVALHIGSMRSVAKQKPLSAGFKCPSRVHHLTTGLTIWLAQQPGLCSILASEASLTHTSPHHVVLPQQGVLVDAGRIQHCQHTFLLRQLLQPPAGMGHACGARIFRAAAIQPWGAAAVHGVL